ncbi:hypothetical protein L2C91_04525 [Rosenbergiella epipactidis]|uniref:hypothetical protein n=1 Tax=Rosenbergiella epipactidis TaxID=1544694 RepID=UPI002026375B|nr:hypothetical protein [Rosenbergiella epipactidis]MCL9667643.1 hypothetical protein [Rosenbergiella epipactidis]
MKIKNVLPLILSLSLPFLSHAEDIKGVNYFGTAWPINFWNSNDVSKDKENLLSIKSDGFNSIIVSVPWSEFQPEVSPIKYNQQAFKRLGELCSLAKSLDMKFFTRVSYLWDYMPNEQYPTTERFFKLYNSKEAIDSWSDYLKKINDKTKNCSDTSFISWEDYWGIIDKLKNQKDKKESAMLSKEIGLSDWILSNKKEYAKSHQSEVTSFGAYLVPDSSTEDFSLVYEWFDSFIMDRLMPIMKNSFKSASLEARVDDDPIFNGNKIVSWYSHKNTYSIDSSKYLFSYWSPAQGAENNGEKVTSNQAIGTFDFMSKKINQSTKNKVIIGQFLFVDNTPSASRNAVIKDDEIPTFLQEISSKLKDNSSGYALWTYRDYRANLIYNSNFTLGCEGWFCKGVHYRKGNANGGMEIIPDSYIEQNIPPERNHFGYADGITRLDLDLSGNGNLLISVGNNKSIVYVKADKNVHLSFPATKFGTTLSIKGLSGKVLLNNVNLYNFEQKSDVRLNNDQGSIFLNSFREINSQM